MAEFMVELAHKLSVIRAKGMLPGWTGGFRARQKQQPFALNLLT